MSGATLKQAQAAVDRRGLPLELVRGEGYHYFVYDQNGHYDTVSEYVCYTNMLSAEQWADRAQSALDTIRADQVSRGIAL